MPRLVRASLRRSPFGSTFEATAEMPKATDPTRLRALIHHPMRRGRKAHGPWHTSAHASQLATRKQIEPRASGRHTAWSTAVGPASPTERAWPVLTLKYTVPTSCTAVAHQSMRSGS